MIQLCTIAKGMLILSHRGYHVDAPENTDAAFGLALSIGADGIETDVQVSADGLPVLFHDRLSPSGEHVSSLTQNELSISAGYSVPILGDVLKKWPNAFWNLEIKAPEALDLTLSALNESRPLGGVLITSFWHTVIRECVTRGCFDCGVLVEHRPIKLKSFFEDLVECGVKAVVWSCDTLDDEMIREARAWKLLNYVYGPITVDEHQRLSNLHIEGVITDRPDIMIERLREDAV